MERVSRVWQTMGTIILIFDNTTLAGWREQCPDSPMNCVRKKVRMAPAARIIAWRGASLIPASPLLSRGDLEGVRRRVSLIPQPAPWRALARRRRDESISLWTVFSRSGPSAADIRFWRPRICTYLQPAAYRLRDGTGSHLGPRALRSRAVRELSFPLRTPAATDSWS